MKFSGVWRQACILALPAWLALISAARTEPAGDEARRLWLTGKYAEAAAAYKSLARQEPLAAAVGLARVHVSQGRLDEAVEALTAAAAAHPRAAEVQAELASLAFETGDYLSARRSADAAIALDEQQLQARWIHAELLRTAGKLDEADKACQWLVDYYNDHDVTDADSLRWIGLGAAQFARWNRLSDQFSFLVNELYPDALAAEPQFWPALYESGRLFLEKYNQAEAARDLRAALEINPNAAEVYAALAELSLQNYELDDAAARIERALELNPRSLAALRARADALLANFDAGGAIDVLESARKLNPRSEETLGRLAAAYGIVDTLAADHRQEVERGTRCGKLIVDATERNPSAGEFFYAMGRAIDASRRFPAAAYYYRLAVQTMPRLTRARGDLGLMLMRLGDEVEAQQVLAESFEIDPFNARVSNMLKVLEVLQGYAVLETEHFVIKFDRGRDELLARYAADYLEQEVYPALTGHFGFEPAGKSLFEIFNRARNTGGHGWFSARMVGLPYIGTVGACAGKMVALASPNDMPEKYNWARVLKHEFVHVLNLQQTNFNIPHWFTEALAVESEGYPRPQVWNELLAARVPKGDLFDLETINLGFVRPKSSLDWQMAYCQAQLYAQYMTATYGDDALARMLQAYADNLTTRAALRRSFDVSQEDFEAGYLQFVKDLAAGLTAPDKPAEQSLAQLQRAHEAMPDDADLAAQLAQALLARRSYAEARRLADKVLANVPRHALASYVLARIRLIVGEDEAAQTLLEEALDRRRPQPDLVNLLAALYSRQRRYDDAAGLYALGAEKFPHDVQWKKSLARVYLTSGDEKRLAGVLAELSELDADDLVIRKKLAQLALDNQNYDQAARWARQALYVDVMDVDVHRMLAEALRGRRDFRAAADEYAVAVKLSGRDAALRFALAETLLAAGDRPQAARALEALLELDPQHPGAAALEKRLKEP